MIVRCYYGSGESAAAELESEGVIRRMILGIASSPRLRSVVFGRAGLMRIRGAGGGGEDGRGVSTSGAS